MPSGTDILRGARNKSWIVVTACLRSARRAIAALHPKQAHDATPVTNTPHLKLSSARMVRESEKNDVQPSGFTARDLRHTAQDTPTSQHRMARHDQWRFGLFFLRAVGGCAFSPQPLLHTIPSVSRAWIVGLKLAPDPARAY